MATDSATRWGFNPESGEFEFVPVSAFNLPVPPLPKAAPIVPEMIVKAESGNGAWGADTFHNLSNGARANGEVHSAHSLLTAADLDWDPEFAELQLARFGKAIPSMIGRAVVRSDTKAPLGIVGDRYELLPHRKLADLADAIVGIDGTALHYGNAGHKDGGALPFMQLKSAPRTIGRNARGQSVDVGDVITLMSSHNGTLKLRGAYGANVIVCDNTYAHACKHLRNEGFAIKHTASGTELLADAIRLAKEARELGTSFDNAALRLLAKRMGDAEMAQLASALIPGEATRAENARRKLIDAWQTSPGAAPGTAWGAAQAVTYYTSHEIATRGDTDRAFGLQIGEGSGADMQQVAWWHLTTEEGEKALQTVKLYRS